MFDILLPIKPYYAYLIMKDEKTVEVRKFLITDPNWSGKFKCYVSKDKASLKRIPEADRAEFEKNIGKVAFEFVNEKIIKYEDSELSFFEFAREANGVDTYPIEKASCLTLRQMHKYSKGKLLYFYHITDLKIYDKPRELGEFYGYNKELEKRFIDGDDFCCHDATNEYGEALTECPADNIKNCYRCWEEWSGWCHRITRPPQSWQYVQSLTD